MIATARPEESCAMRLFIVEEAVSGLAAGDRAADALDGGRPAAQLALVD
jgi:hypothetical protein